MNRLSKPARAAHRAGHSIALETFRRLPLRWRIRLIRGGAPLFTVGAVVVMCDQRRRILLVRQRHTGAWALPGGLLHRGEDPATAALREVGEELGVRLDPVGLAAPLVCLDPVARRVDFVYTTPPPAAWRPDGVETLEAAWHPAHDLPRCVGGTMQLLEQLDIR